MNLLESEAVLLTVTFSSSTKNHNVLIRSDNTTFVVYVNKHGENKISTSLLQNVGFMEASNKEQHPSEGSSHCRQSEHSTRPTKQGPYQTDRMDCERYCSESNICYLGQTPGRPICLSPESQDGNILLMGTTSPNINNRCSDFSLGKNVCIYISSNFPDTQGAGTHDAISVQININSSSLAKTSLVSVTSSAVHCTANTSTTQTRSSKITENSNISSQSGGFQCKCMAVIDRQFRSECFSKNVRKLLSASWRTGRVGRPQTS